MIRRSAALGGILAVLVGIPLVARSVVDQPVAAAAFGNVYVAAQADTIYLPSGVSVTLIGGTPPPEVSPSPAPSASATPAPSVSPSPSPSSAPSSATPTPTATPTPSPVPTLSPTPPPTPTPTPAGGDPWSVPFGTRPASGTIDLSGAACTGTAAAPFVIENKTFSGITGRAAIRLTNCSHVVIRSVDFIDVAGGVYVAGGSDVTLQDARYRNITGPAHDSAGKRTTNIANLIQTNGLNGGTIRHNKGRCGDTEDIVSVYASSNVLVEDNAFEGVATSSAGCLAWVSNSGSGIMVGDGTGRNNVVRNNSVLTPGQVGIAIAGGQGNTLTGNVVISAQRPLSNVGMYVANYSSGTCSGNAVTNNRVQWKNAGGSLNGKYLPTSCSGTVDSGNAWSDTTLVPSAYAVIP